MSATPKRFPPNIKPIVEMPNPVGGGLTTEQIEAIAQTVYSRFIHNPSLPDWKCAFAKEIRIKTIDMVKKVVDSMVINHYTLKQFGIKEDETV